MAPDRACGKKPWERDPMASSTRTKTGRKVNYPTSDGKPMAETDVHRENMIDLIQTLQDRYADAPEIYVSGNLLMFYEEGSGHKHVAPDVFVAKGVPKLPPRENYKIWEEGKGPDVVIELTSKTTKKEDRKKKFELYRDVLKVPEYFLFDPNADWLNPPVQGYRLVDGNYEPIKPLPGRKLPSEELGLNLSRSGYEFRLFDPATGRMLPTHRETVAEAATERRLAEAARRELDLVSRESQAAQQLLETRLELSEVRLRLAEAEIDRLRAEIAALRGGNSDSP